MRYEVCAQGYLLGRPMTLERLLAAGAGDGFAQQAAVPVLEPPVALR
jgi:hypothetical protein